MDEFSDLDELSGDEDALLNELCPSPPTNQASNAKPNCWLESPSPPAPPVTSATGLRPSMHYDDDDDGEVFFGKASATERKVTLRVAAKRRIAGFAEEEEAKQILDPEPSAMSMPAAKRICAGIEEDQDCPSIAVPAPSPLPSPVIPSVTLPLKKKSGILAPRIKKGGHFGVKTQASLLSPGTPAASAPVPAPAPANSSIFSPPPCIVSAHTTPASTVAITLPRLPEIHRDMQPKQIFSEENLVTMPPSSLPVATPSLRKPMSKIAKPVASAIPQSTGIPTRKVSRIPASASTSSAVILSPKQTLKQIPALSPPLATSKTTTDCTMASSPRVISLSENENPFLQRSKITNSPDMTKVATPKSRWSPVRKAKAASLEDEVLMCTKRRL